MSQPENSHLKDYIQAVLQNTSSDNPDPPKPSTTTDPDVAATELIDLYFALEEPDERDEVFKQLVALQSPLVVEFLLAMMQHDQDKWLQIAAAAELTRLGHAEGLACLQQEVQQPSSFALFEYAADLLAEVEGPSSYAIFAHIWQDEQRDVDHQIKAMHSMLRADAALAITDFMPFVRGAAAQAIWPEEQLAVAVTAFVRYDSAKGMEVFLELQKNLQSKPLAEADLQEEAEAFVAESLILLQE